MKKIISTSEAPGAIGPYSQAVRTGNFLFCSGQIPLDPKSGQMVSGDIAAHTRRVLDNIATAAKVRPIVIQSLFMRIHGAAPPDVEIDAFCDRLSEIVASGGQLKLVQVYTVARPPAESFVTSLTESELESIAAKVRTRGIAAEVFGGS